MLHPDISCGWKRHRPSEVFRNPPIYKRLHLPLSSPVKNIFWWANVFLRFKGRLSVPSFYSSSLKFDISWMHTPPPHIIVQTHFSYQICAYKCLCIYNTHVFEFKKYLLIYKLCIAPKTIFWCLRVWEVAVVGGTQLVGAYGPPCHPNYTSV